MHFYCGSKNSPTGNFLEEAACVPLFPVRKMMEEELMMQHHDTKVPCILPDEEELFVPTIYRNDPNPNAYAASPYEQFFSSELVLGMDHQMRFTYPNGEIVVSIKCPIEYYDFLTLNWTVWVPEKCTPGYHLFHKCSDMELLSRALPNLTIGKTTERKGSTLLTELLVSPSSPVRVMYNTRLHVLRLSFFHSRAEENRNIYSRVLTGLYIHGY
jgi:hypothetical protein